jgi:phosphopantetheine adenylyltransferase
MRKNKDFSKEFDARYPNGVLVDSLDMLFMDEDKRKKSKRRINSSTLSLVFVGVGVFILFGIGFLSYFI